ncbi:MAG: GIY-YIG nuclease family protein [Saprospiraceae bacterium]
MKNYITYILYSESINKYYTGSTSKKVEERLKRHNSNHKGYTGKAKDWEVLYVKMFGTISESRKLEKEIQKRGAKRYILAKQED